jgi:hypothetical protein
MADLEKKIDKVLHATTRRQRIPSLYELRGTFYRVKSGKPVRVAPVKPMLVRPSGLPDLWTWMEKGGRAWGAEDPRGKERTPTRRYNEWVARGGLKRAARAKQAMGGKRRHSDSDVVDVMFRVVKAGEWKGTVEAWFPSLPGTNAYYRDMLTYAHIGQHGSGDIDYMQQKTRNAKPSEYASLKRELESGPDGYKLRVVKKMTRKHYEQRKAACQ